MANLAACTGQWVELNPGGIACDGVITQMDTSLLDALLNVTPEAVLYVYAWGIAAVMVPWSLGYAVGVAKSAIRRV